MTKANPIVPVYRRTLRTAMARGVDPLNSYDSMAEAYRRYAHMCGAVAARDQVTPDPMPPRALPDDSNAVS